MSLKRVDRGRYHSYRLDGKPVPGVTTLLNKGIPKPALVPWAAKVVAEWIADNPGLTDQMAAMGGRQPLIDFLKAIPNQKRNEAAVRGTDVHGLAERLVHGEEVEVPEHLSPYVEGYVEWLDTENPRPLWTERPIASRQWWYAGTFDLIATWRGETWLLDVKTSSWVYGENALQLAAYAGAEFLLDAEDNEVPMPAIDRLGVIHVRPDGTQVFPVFNAEAAWKDFLHAAWVGRAEDRIKNYIGKPIEDEAGAVA